MKVRSGSIGFAKIPTAPSGMSENQLLKQPVESSAGKSSKVQAVYPRRTARINKTCPTRRTTTGSRMLIFSLALPKFRVISLKVSQAIFMGVILNPSFFIFSLEGGIPISEKERVQDSIPTGGRRSRGEMGQCEGPSGSDLSFRFRQFKFPVPTVLAIGECAGK